MSRSMLALTESQAKGWIKQGLSESKARRPIRPVIERLCELQGVVKVGEAIAALFDARAGVEYWSRFDADERQRHGLLDELDRAITAARRSLWRGSRDSRLLEQLAVTHQLVQAAKKRTLRPRQRSPKLLASPLVRGVGRDAFERAFRDLGARPREAEDIVTAIGGRSYRRRQP